MRTDGVHSTNSPDGEAGGVQPPVISISRTTNTISGISWFSHPASTAWSQYMAWGGTTGNGPTGTITAPTGELVKTWALRSFAENNAGQGWTFESGSLKTTTPNIVAEIRASDGAARFGGTVTAPLFRGTLEGNASSAAVAKLSISSAKLNGGSISDLNDTFNNAAQGDVFFHTFTTAAANKHVTVNHANGILSLVSFPSRSNGLFGKQFMFADSDNLYIRRVSDGEFGEWKELIHTGNMKEFAPSVNGDSAKGTWKINIAGSAMLLNGMHSSMGAAACTIVERDQTGAVHASGIHQTSKNDENPTIRQVMVTNGLDNLLRKASINALTAAVVQEFSKAPRAFTLPTDIEVFADSRLRRNIRKIDGALAKVETLQGVVFDSTETGQRSAGLASNNLQKALPEATKIHETGYLTVAPGSVIGLLVEAIKELSDQNKELKVKLAVLENKVSAGSK